MTDTHTYEIHEFANLVPKMSRREREELTAHIRNHGQAVSIVLFEGKILDGRHRAEACAALGLEPRVEHFVGDEAAAFQYVCAQAFQRRNLTDAQRAMAVARAWNFQQEKRLASGSLCSTKQPPIGGEGTQVQSAQAVVGSMVLPTQAEMAAQANVSQRSVERAAKVIHDAPAPVAQAVAEGKLSLQAAETVAKSTRQNKAVVAKRINEGVTPSEAVKSVKPVAPPAVNATIQPKPKPGQHPTFAAVRTALGFPRVTLQSIYQQVQTATGTLQEAQSLADELADITALCKDTAVALAATIVRLEAGHGE